MSISGVKGLNIPFTLLHTKKWLYSMFNSEYFDLQSNA